MADNLRRHSVLISDRELVVLQAAVRVYVAVTTIVGAINAPAPRTQNADLLRLTEVLMGHSRCSCPVPQGEA